ncbi:MAG: HAD family hydrolase [Chloroflexota bacterium]
MFSPNGIRAILFDLDGTLRFSEPRFFHILYEYAVQAGCTATVDNHRCAMRWQHRYWAQSPEMLADMAAFGFDQEIFWLNHTRLFIEALGVEPALAKSLAVGVHRRITDEYHPISQVPAETIETLKSLQQAGFLMAVVSNRSSNFEAELADLGLSSYFQYAIAAGEINSWKPEAEIFLHSVQRLGITPQQALYVGDNYYADVLGAQKAGLHPVLVDPDEVFPDADCPVIANVGLLASVLPK